MFSQKCPTLSNGSTRNGFLSSGFHSDLSTQTSQLKQSLSSAHSPNIIRPNVMLNSSHATAPSMTCLWGKAAVESGRRRLAPEVAPPNGHVAARCLPQLGGFRKSTPSSSSTPFVPELDILRELIFVLNGVGGELIRFDQASDAFRITPKVHIHPGDADSVHRIAECGWLHDRIGLFIKAFQEDRLAGPMSQSLASGLHENLTEYYRLIATLESQLGRDSRGVIGANAPHPSVEQSESSGLLLRSRLGWNDATGQDSALTPQNLTLTRLALWTQEPRSRLRMLASLCEVCRGKRGGALASEVYAYTFVGDPVLAVMMHLMLKNLASTLLRLISLWIYDGQLDDPFQEFFVACNPSVKKERLWHEKYSIRRPMIPSFITSNQAVKIFLAGKSINFLQHACGEKQNIKDREIIRNSRLKRVESMFEQDLDPSFDRMVSIVYQQTSRYLLQTLIERYHFLDHLRATRQFLLLGQGDFIVQLMDLLNAELSKPATQMLIHQLSSVLETAIRTTNAQYEPPEILQRLDVRLLDMSVGDTGWDVFSLDYQVDGPLATIFTDDCRLMYLRSFNFLWRAKRMEFSVSSIWKQQFLLGRMGHGIQTDLEPVLHLAELLGAELRHCVQQLQYYVNFEVLECAWDILVKRIHAATDLDEAIEAHQAFLSSVITQCLLDAPSRPLISQLRTIFDLVLNYTQVVQDLNAVANAELTARERHAQRMFEATKRGKPGIDETQETQERARRMRFVEKYVGPFQARIRILASSYREMAINFIRMLNSHPDHNLKFLAEYLNFNDHYKHQSVSSLEVVQSSSTSNDFPARYTIKSGFPGPTTTDQFPKPPKHVAAGDLRSS